MASQSSGDTAHPSTMAHGTKEEIFFRRFCCDDKQIANLKKLEYKPNKFKAQLLHQAETRKYVGKKLKTIPCFFEFNGRLVKLTSLDENKLQDAKDLIEKSVLIRSIHEEEYTRVKTKFLQFSENYITVPNGDETVLVFTSDIEHDVDQILNIGCSMPLEETCSNGPDQFQQKGSDDKRNIKDGRSRLETGSRGPDQFHQKGSDDKRNIKDGSSQVETGSRIKDGRSRVETGSRGQDQFHQKGSDDKRNIKDGRSQVETGSRRPDQFHQKGSDDKRNIKYGRSEMETGSRGPDQFHQKGIEDKGNIKDGRQEPHGAGKATVDVGVANKPDRNIGTNQETDLEAGCVEHFFDENPSFYIDANIADILFSEMSSEITTIEESGVKLHHDNGVITITGRYFGAELVKHRLEALATSVHTKGFYHDCSSRYSCIQYDSIQEILNQAKTKVWYENVKPSQVISKYLAKRISVNVYHGSVIGQLSDAIVYPVAQETGQQVPSGPTAHQLYQYGGEDFQRNIRFSKNIPWGSQFFSHQVPGTSYRRICLLFVTDWLTNSPHNEENIVDRLYHILDNANREVNCSSLAIPLELGCRIPPLQVLDFIMKAIDKYLAQQPEYRKLWTVSLVVTDSRYLQQVRQVLDNWKYKGTVQQPHKDLLDVDVSLIMGSLFDQRVDAIVVTIHKTLDQSKGGLAMELRRREGKALEERCKLLIPNGINPGEAVAVTAGDLNMCKHVILGYLPKNVNYDKKLYLKLLLENIFKAAKTQQVKSLAMPAIGSGALNYPTQMCVTEILRSCFIHAQECGIQTVNLVVDDQQLYQEFDGYLWKYQETMATINESQKHSEEVISADCDDLKVTITDTDHFGSFADMVIFHLDGSKRQDDVFMNGLRRESCHLRSHPWICEKVHITEEEYEGQYNEAFKIAKDKSVQLITLIWKGVENEGQDNLQKISSIVELMRKELSEHFPKVKLHVIVSQELKSSILGVIRSETTSRFPSLSSFRSYIPGFGNKISWKIENRPNKQFSAINGINLVAVSRDSKLLETYTNTLAQCLQDIDQQYCEKYKPQVPPRSKQKERSDQVSGSFMEGKYGSSPEVPRNAESDTSNSRKPIAQEQGHGKETKHIGGNRTELSKVDFSHKVEMTLSVECFSQKVITKIVDELLETDIKCSLNNELISIECTNSQVEALEQKLKKWRNRAQNGCVFIRNISPELHQKLLCCLSEDMRRLVQYFEQDRELKIAGDIDSVNKIQKIVNYQSDVIDLTEEQLQIIKEKKRMFESGNKDVILRLDRNKLYLYCLENEMTQMMHKLKIVLGIVKSTSRGRQKQGKFASLDPDVPAVAACNNSEMKPLDKTPSTVAPPATVMTPKLCMTFKVGRKWQSKVYNGNILGLNVDCIVNVNQEGSMSEIVKAGGREVERELQEVSKSQQLEPTTCVISNPGLLKFKKILHVGELKWGGYSNEQKCREDVFTALHNCLMVADRNNMSSIGIPALSSGEFGIPLNICAEEYCRALREYEGMSNCLEEIHLVFMLDDYVEQVLKIFQQTFTVEQSDTDTELQQQSLVHVDPATYKQTHHESGVSISEQEADIFEGQHRDDIGFCYIEPGIFDVRGIEVKVYTGDILKLDVACIVNAANDKLEHGGGVARVISKAAGKRFQQESHEFIKGHGRLEVSECVYTSGCDLKYDYVLHAVGPRWRSAREETRTRKELRDTIINTLRCVEQLNLPSVGIPSISAGIFGVPKKVCAEEYGNGIVQFIQRYNPIVLKEIHFVDVAPDLVRIICDTFQRFSTGKPPVAVYRQPSAADRPPGAADRCPVAADRCPVAANRPLECENPVFNQQSQQNRTSSNTQKHKGSSQNESMKLMSMSLSSSGGRNTCDTDGTFPSSTSRIPYASLPPTLDKRATDQVMQQSLTDRNTYLHHTFQNNPIQTGSSRDTEKKSCSEHTSWNIPVKTDSCRHKRDARAMQQSTTFNESKPEAMVWNNQGQTASGGHTGDADGQFQSRISPVTLSTSVSSLKASANRKEVQDTRNIKTTKSTERKANESTEGSQMKKEDTLGTRQNPYKYDLVNQNKDSVKVFVYKHDISLCRVDAIVSVWTSPGRKQGSIAAAIEKQVGPEPTKPLKDLENSIRHMPEKRKTTFRSVIYANMPTINTTKDEKQSIRELRKCLQNIFVTATKDKNEIRSVALPVLSLGLLPPELCCEILVDETLRACYDSKQKLGRLHEIHLIGFEEGIVYALKGFVEEKQKCWAKEGNQYEDWVIVKKKKERSS